MLMRRNRIMLLAILFLLLISFSVGAEGSFPVEVTDDLERQIMIKQQPERIISLAPSHTETLFALDLEERIVGVTDYANYPQEAQEKASVGSIREPNVERIVELKPDLVLAAAVTPKTVVEKLTQLDITVVGLAPNTVTEIIEDISLIGKLTGQVEEGRKLTVNLQKRKKEVGETVEENVTSEEQPEVFYEVWKQPLRTAGSGTFIDNLIQLAGGVNIAHDAQQQWPQYSFEQLLADNPDVYLSTPHSWKSEVTVETIKQRENFQQLKAIEEERIYILSQDIVNRAGPRIIDALEKIAAALHPKLFKN